MPRLDDPTIRIDRPRPEFRDANPEAFARAQGDPDTLRRLSVIEERATTLKNRFREHFDRNEEVWVVSEAMRLTERRTFPTLQHPKPRYAPSSDFTELMMGQARRNVHARGLNRLSAINTVKTALQNAIVNSAPRLAQERQPSNDTLPQQRSLKMGQKQRQ